MLFSIRIGSCIAALSMMSILGYGCGSDSADKNDQNEQSHNDTVLKTDVNDNLFEIKNLSVRSKTEVISSTYTSVSVVFTLNLYNETALNSARCLAGTLHDSGGYEAEVHIGSSCTGGQVCLTGPSPTNGICDLEAQESTGIVQLEAIVYRTDSPPISVASGTTYTLTLNGILEDAALWTATAQAVMP